MRLVSLGGQAIPADPRTKLDFPSQDVTPPASGVATLEIETDDVPADATVLVRLVHGHGESEEVTATFAGPTGTGTTNLWTADLSIHDGFSLIQARAVLP